MPRRVRVYHAPGCHLCGPAIEIVEAAREKASFDLELVDISTDEDLEARYRESIPVVEIDGEIVSTLVVDPETLHDVLS